MQRKQEVLKEEMRRIKEQSRLPSRGQDESSCEEKMPSYDVTQPVDKNRVSYSRTNSVSRKRYGGTKN